MPSQPDLFPKHRQLTIEPHAGNGPRLWVRRVVIWRDPDNIIQNIELRPGLNIIWSPDPSDVKAKDRAMGHAAGKTLFLRLVRYCLGDVRYSTDNQRASISAKFPNGSVGAEVMLDGTCWTVVRPLGNSGVHYAEAGESVAKLRLTTLPGTSVQPLVEAIEAAFLAGIRTFFPKPAFAYPWSTALGWLARDQDCRFANALQWRSPLSNSRWPALSMNQGQRLEVVRLLAGALQQGELEARRRAARLTTSRRLRKSQGAKLREEAAFTRDRLRMLLQMDEDHEPVSSMSLVDAREQAARLAASVSTVNPRTGEDELVSLRKALATAEEGLKAAQLDANTTSTQLVERERMLVRIKAELPGAQFGVISAGNPACPICDVALDKVLLQGCKLSHKVPDLTELQRKYDELKAELKDESDAIRILKAHDTDNQQAVAVLAAEVEEARSRVQELEAARAAADDARFASRSASEHLERLETLLRDINNADRDVGLLTDQINEARQQAADFFLQEASAVTRWSKHFDDVVASLLNGMGKLVLEKNKLDLRIEVHGNTSTPAIESLKVLAFDLSALFMTIEGRTCMPPLLMHDSPREGDLGLSLYHDVFSLLERLERLCGSIPTFQYIVTTTTRPPQHMQKKPWLRLKLSSEPTRERLLQTDL